MPHRWLAPIALLALLLPLLSGQTPSTPAGSSKGGGDLEFVEKLISTRAEYQKAMENLRVHYLKVGDPERLRWVEEELLSFHRTPKHAFILDLDVPPPNLRGESPIAEANALFARAMEFKRQTNVFTFGERYVDNQRRVEILLRELIQKYPQSNRISSAAFYLGEVYESKAYKQYRRAATFFERSFQWNPNTDLPGRLRAARVYDKDLNERGRAIELYREVLTHDHDPSWRTEATRRLQELGGGNK